MKEEQEPRAKELFPFLGKAILLRSSSLSRKRSALAASFHPCNDSSNRSSRSFSLSPPSSHGTWVEVGALPIAIVLLPMALPGRGVR